MNPEHLKAVIWLRWRLRSNQFKKAGTLNAVIFSIITVMAFVSMVGLFIGGTLVGGFLLPNVSPLIQMYVWDGLIAAVIFSWSIGLLTDLQRAESLALDRFMHLPISLRGVFLINYLSSLATLTLMCFVPACTGMILGQALSQPLILLVFPLLAAFLLAMTAITYQFQGWLALLMSNPRRRRTVIVIVTMSFVLLAQFPQLIHVIRPWEMNKNAIADHQKHLMELGTQYAAGKMKADEYSKAVTAANDDYKRITDKNEEHFKDQATRGGQLANLAIPPGWLALGASGLADGKVLPALLATLGFTLIGAFSLSRAYRTTLRIYSGVATATGQVSAVKAPAGKPSGTLFVERKLPWVSEYASGIATAGFRGLIRAPEIKMMLIGPIIMLVVFGGAFGSQIGNIPREVSPLIAFGAAAMTVLIMVQLTANQFGYDRTGFRAYVLGPVPRREILIGKNLAIAPFALGVALLGLAIAGIVFPMRIDHYPAALLQVVSLFLVSCLLMNYMSIYCPIAVASGTMRPAHVHWGPVLMQMLIMMVYPLCTVPLLLPYGLELLLEQFGMPEGVPVSLLLSLAILFIAILIYRKMITSQGTLLHTREKKILEVVVSKEE